MQVHLDTDFGGDPDDAAALVMLLGWPDVEVVGITTNLDDGGRRAGCVQHYLALTGCTDIPVVAGAGRSLTTLAIHEPTWGDERHWPDPVPATPAPPGAALDLMARNVADGATVVAVGAYTNLALLEVAHPGVLAGAPVVVMGGFLGTLADDLPPWGPERDWNVQCDTRSAEIVAGTADLTLSTMSGSIGAQLRRRDLPRLRAAGPVGDLLARQAEVYAEDASRAELVAAHPGLAPDLVNFHWDPVACAVALGWDGVDVVEQRLSTRYEGDVLRFVDDPAGRTVRCLTGVDPEAFADAWVTAVETAAARAR